MFIYNYWVVSSVNIGHCEIAELLSCGLYVTYANTNFLKSSLTEILIFWRTKVFRGHNTIN